MTSTLNLEQMRPAGFLARVASEERAKIEAVSRGRGWQVNERCLLCGSAEYAAEFEAYGIPIRACVQCSLRYVERMAVDLADVYSGEENLQQAKSAYLANVDYRVQRFATERVALIREFLPFAPGQRLLDVGCGTGWFLGYARDEGYAVAGYEFSGELVEFTSARVGCRVYSGRLEDIDVGFDVITLFDVIEHVPQPAQVARQLGSILKPGGIVLLYTPNWDSVAIPIMRDRSNLIVPTRHLSYFNIRSMRRLAQLADLEPEWFATAGIDIGDLKAYAEALEGREPSPGLWQALSDRVQPAIDQAGLGNHLRAVLRRA